MAHINHKRAQHGSFRPWLLVRSPSRGMNAKTRPAQSPTPSLRHLSQSSARSRHSDRRAFYDHPSDNCRVPQNADLTAPFSGARYRKRYHGYYSSTVEIVPTTVRNGTASSML
jgi:hypothetical protein